MAPKSQAARRRNMQTTATKAMEKREIHRHRSDHGLATPDRPLSSGGHMKKQVTRSVKAGLEFPVAPIGRYLKEGHYSQHVGSGAPIYLAAVLEYLTAEVLELTGYATKDRKKSHITPRDLFIAVMDDKELGKLLDGFTIPDGGVVPYIDKVLLQKKAEVTAAESPK